MCVYIIYYIIIPDSFGIKILLSRTNTEMDIVGLEMKPLHVRYFGIAASIKTAAFNFTFQCIP